MTQISDVEAPEPSQPNGRRLTYFVIKAMDLPILQFNELKKYHWKPMWHALVVLRSHNHELASKNIIGNLKSTYSMQKTGQDQDG